MWISSQADDVGNTEILQIHSLRQTLPEAKINRQTEAIENLEQK